MPETLPPNHAALRPAIGEALSSLRSFGVSVREFLRDPSMVGSAFPASRSMVDKMFADVPWKKIDVFVEYGPGTGRFTEEALARLGPQSNVIAIDTSPGFTQNLCRKIKDPRLHAVEGSAREVRSILLDRGFDQADCILSGLPFSTLPPKEGDKILDASCSVLSDNGHFLAYQMREAIGPLLEKRFFKVDQRYEWRNIPPCHLYFAGLPRAHQRTFSR